MDSFYFILAMIVIGAPITGYGAILLAKMVQ